MQGTQPPGPVLKGSASAFLSPSLEPQGCLTGLDKTGSSRSQHSRAAWDSNGNVNPLAATLSELQNFADTPHPSEHTHTHPSFTPPHTYTHGPHSHSDPGTPHPVRQRQQLCAMHSEKFPSPWGLPVQAEGGVGQAQGSRDPTISSKASTFPTCSTSQIRLSLGYPCPLPPAARNRGSRVGRGHIPGKALLQATGWWPAQSSLTLNPPRTADAASEVSFLASPSWTLPVTAEQAGRQASPNQEGWRKTPGLGVAPSQTTMADHS